MAIHVLTDTRIYLAQFDLSAKHNQIEITQDVEEKDATGFALNGWKAFLAGLKSARAKGKAFWDADATAGTGLQDVVQSKLGVIDVPFTVIPEGLTAGNFAATFKAMTAKFARSGQVGELAMGDIEAATSSGVLVQGTLLHTGTAAAGGNGTSRQLGAVSATQRVYAALHVVALSGGTLTVKLQSDNATGFPSSADQATFTALTGPGSEWKEVAGAITDDWWRVSWTLTGGSATFIVVMGIQ